jgi:hypothetical protein
MKDFEPKEDVKEDIEEEEDAEAVE